MNEIQTTDNANASLSLFDPAHYSTIVQVAEMMAVTNLTPETLRGTRSGQTFTPFPIAEIKANCFMVTEQAMRWGLSPTACAQHASIVRGKLMWEGKLVAAVLEQLTSVRLSYTYTGAGVSRMVTVSGRFADETEERTVTGTVKDWKTSQWTETNYDQRLAYRGAREWSRRHAPAAMLGITTSDEELKKPDSRDVTPLREEFIDPTKLLEIEATPEPEPIKEAKKPEKATPPVNSAKVTIMGYQAEDNLHIVKLEAGGKVIEAKTSDKTIGSLAEFNIGEAANAGLQQTTKGVKLTSLEVL